MMMYGQSTPTPVGNYILKLTVETPEQGVKYVQS